MSFWNIIETAIAVGSTLHAVGKENDLKAAKLARENRAYKDHSITCRKCGELAGPIAGTYRNYRCRCGRQFAGPRHPY